MKKRIILIVGCILFLAQVVYSEIVTLTPSDSLQDAVDNASDGDTLVLSSGIYFGTNNHNIVISGKSLTIRSEDISNPSATIIDAENLTGSFIFEVVQNENDPEGTVVRIEGLTLTRAGKYSLFCSGDTISSSVLVLNNCIISNNSNSNIYFAGIRLKNTGRVDLISCLVTDNQCNGLGAGLYAEKCKMVNIVKSVFCNNSTVGTNGVAGGLYIDSCEAIFYDCLFYGNSATKQGGGLLLDNRNGSSRKVRFYNCMVNGNIANKGGGIYIGSNAKTEIYNSVIYGNDNYGIYSEHTTGGVTIKNNIIWENDLEQIHFFGAETSGLIDVSYSIVENGYSYGNNIITDNPEFLESGSWTEGQWNEPYAYSSNAWRLGSLSPGIDGGDPNYLPPSTESQDIDGQPRFIGSQVDIGIDEYLGPDSGLVYNTRSQLWYWSINQAIDAGSEGDELLVSPGRYNESLIIDTPANITISGRQPYNDEFRKNTILDASEENGSAIYFTPNVSFETTVSGLTISGGSGYDDLLRNETVGGGIYINQSSPTISFCRIEQNEAETGGGIYINAASPQIKNCIIKNNICANLGPAIAVLNSSNPFIANCAINTNTTQNSNDTHTGAIHFDISSGPQEGIIRNCLFNSNLPYAIYNNSSGFIELNSSILYNNNNDPNIIDDRQIYAGDMDLYELNYCAIPGGWDGNGRDNIESYPSFISTTYTDENGNTQNTTHDYRLSSGQEYLNLGDTDYDPDDDILDLDGHKRKDFCRVDIGPWEYPSITNLLNAIPSLVLYNSNTYCSVQEAIDIAPESSTTGIGITLTKGYFNENIVVNKPKVTIAGSGLFKPEDIIINGSIKTIDTSGPFGPDDPNDPNYMGAVITLADNKALSATISRLTIRGGIGSLDKDGRFKGGAISSRNNNDVFITSCIIEDNEAEDGGGIFISGAEKATITQTIIRNNSTDGFGGGVLLKDCDKLSIDSSVIAQNNAQTAGGIYSDNSSIDIDFCTIADNISINPASAIHNDNPQANTTISNSIIYGNSGSQFYWSDPNAIFDIDYSCIEGGYDGDHIISDAPLFIDPTEQDYRISVYSPCYNMADPEGVSAYDLNTLTARKKQSDTVFNFNYDMGAYEMSDILADYGKNKPVYNQDIDRYYYTIQDAIDDAGMGDTILLEPGLYQEQLVINKDSLTIKGRLEPANMAMARTIIEAKTKTISTGLPDQAANGPVITLSEFQAADIHLEGLTLIGGKGQSHNFDNYQDPNYLIPTGGGLLSINNAGLTMKWCNITRNQPNPGAELIGGGMALIGCSRVKLENCLITNNTTTRRRGGAIWAKDIYPSRPGEDDSYGLIISNCTITANTASDSKPTIDSEFTTCGGVLIDGNSSGIILKNSIITANAPTNMYPLNDSENITADHCLLAGITGTDIYSFEPGFAAAGGYDFHLLSTAGRWNTWKRSWQKDNTTSPAVDAGAGTEAQINAELYPHGENINLGVYGASPESSLSSSQNATAFDWANLNHDQQVDIYDLAILAANWYSIDCFNISDSNRDCIVDLQDLQTFLEGWLEEE